jgi:large subunit ribosomal protein L33
LLEEGLGKMAKNRVIKHFECGGCGIRNYSKKASAKKKDAGKLSLSKYCSGCRKHNLHKETK